MIFLDEDHDRLFAGTIKLWILFAYIQGEIGLSKVLQKYFKSFKRRIPNLTENIWTEEAPYGQTFCALGVLGCGRVIL